MNDDMLKDWAETVAHYRACLYLAMPTAESAFVDQLIIDWHRTALERAREALRTEIRHMDTIQIAHIVPDVARRTFTDAVGVHR